MSIQNRIRYALGMDEKQLAAIKRSLNKTLASVSLPRGHEVKANEALMTAIEAQGLESIRLYPFFDEVADLFEGDAGLKEADEEVVHDHAKAIVKAEDRGRPIPNSPFAGKSYEADVNGLIRMAVMAERMNPDGDGPMWEAFRVSFKSVQATSGAMTNARRAAAYKHAAQWVADFKRQMVAEQRAIDELLAISALTELRDRRKSLFVNDGRRPMAERVASDVGAQVKAAAHEALSAALSGETPLITTTVEN